MAGHCLPACLGSWHWTGLEPHLKRLCSLLSCLEHAGSEYIRSVYLNLFYALCNSVGIAPLVTAFLCGKQSKEPSRGEGMGEGKGGQDL